MSESANIEPVIIFARTADVVASYVANNHVAARELPDLIVAVHTALTGLVAGVPAAPAEPEVEKPSAAQIRKSITPEALVSFIDGKPYKTLKRHLTKHGLEPRTYRDRYGLPSDYPMTAPSYSEHRSSLALNAKFGHRQPDPAAEPAPKAKGTRRQTAQAA